MAPVYTDLSPPGPAIATRSVVRQTEGLDTEQLRLATVCKSTALVRTSGSVDHTPVSDGTGANHANC